MHDVPDVRRGDRLEAALAQRLADDARNQVVRDVVQDLVPVALLDDGRRHLAGPETRARARSANSPWPRGRFRRRRRPEGISNDRCLRVSETSVNSVFIRSDYVTAFAASGYGEAGFARCRRADFSPRLKMDLSLSRRSSSALFRDERKPMPAPPKLARRFCAASEGVRKGGVEPPRPFGHRILSPARLPVPPLSREV